MVSHPGFVKIATRNVQATTHVIVATTMKWIIMNKQSPVVEFYGGPHDGLIMMVPQLSLIIEDFVDCVNYVAVLCPEHGTVTKNSGGRYIYEYVHE